MSNKYSPQEALQHYFDELLAGEDKPPVRYAEPDLAQHLAQQQKLEKLLQASRSTLADQALKAVSRGFGRGCGTDGLAGFAKALSGYASLTRPT